MTAVFGATRPAPSGAPTEGIKTQEGKQNDRDDNDGVREIKPIGIGLNRIEVEQQVAVAHRYPRFNARRTPRDFEMEVIQLATIDPEVAAGCFYTLLRTDRYGKVVKIEGASIRLAESVAHCWRNVHLATRIVEIGEDFLTAQGFGWDLETNERVGSEVSRRITTTKGHRFGEDMIQVTCSAAQAIAFRNIVLRLIPPSRLKHPLEEIKRASIGPTDIDLVKRQQRALRKMEEVGAPPEQVFAGTWP
jgi:hypothetical protein